VRWYIPRVYGDIAIQVGHCRLLERAPGDNQGNRPSFCKQLAAIVMAYIAGLKKEHFIELKGDHWYAKP